MSSRVSPQRRFKTDEDVDTFLVEVERILISAKQGGESHPYDPDESADRETSPGERYRQFLIDECGFSPLYLLSGKEYDKQFERESQEVARRNEIKNQKRVEEGLHPIYYPSEDELSLIGFHLPTELIQNKDSKYVEMTVKKECERIRKLKAEGKEWEPWSEFEKASFAHQLMSD